MLTYNLESRSTILVCWFHSLFIYLFTLQWNLFTTEWHEFLIMTNSCLLMPTLPFSLCDELLFFFVFCRPFFVRGKDIPVVLCTLPECRFQRDGEMSLIRFCCMHSVANICWYSKHHGEGECISRVTVFSASIDDKLCFVAWGLWFWHGAVTFSSLSCVTLGWWLLALVLLTRSKTENRFHLKKQGRWKSSGHNRCAR